MSPSYLVYDCEIARCIPDSGTVPAEGLMYCAGWTDYAGMGVSIVGAYDSFTDAYRVFGTESLDAFREIAAQRDLLVSFNGQRFDDALLAAHGALPQGGRYYDLYHQITLCRGREKGWGLGPLAQANLGEGKSGNGAQGPAMWQRGEHARVADYCLGDVRLLRRLFERVLTTGGLTSPVDGMFVAIAAPEGW